MRESQADYLKERKQTEQLNILMISQIARQFLVKAKETPDPDKLHLYQLVEWGLKSGQIQMLDVTNQWATVDLLETVEALMYQWMPQGAMDLLLKEGPDQWTPWVDARELKNQENPIEASAYLAEMLESALDERGARIVAKEAKRLGTRIQDDGMG